MLYKIDRLSFIFLKTYIYIYFVTTLYVYFNTLKIMYLLYAYKNIICVF